MKVLQKLNTRFINNLAQQDISSDASKELEDNGNTDGVAVVLAHSDHPFRRGSSGLKKPNDVKLREVDNFIDGTEDIVARGPARLQSGRRALDRDLPPGGVQLEHQDARALTALERRTLHLRMVVEGGDAPRGERRVLQGGDLRLECCEEGRVAEAYEECHARQG